MIIVLVIAVLIMVYYVYKKSNENKENITIVEPSPVPAIRRESVVSNSTVFNPYPQWYLNQYENPELIRVK